MPYKITCAGRCIAAHALCPAGRGPALSLVLGVAGCNSRAGLVRFMHAQADYETREGALRPTPAHAFAHLLRLCPRAHAHRSPPVPSSSLTMILRVPAWRPGRVRQVPILRASFWRGRLYFAVQIHLRSLSDSDIGIHANAPGQVCVALQVLVVRYVARGMIVMHLNVASIM